MKEKLNLILQYILPKKLVSKLAGILAKKELKIFTKYWISIFIRYFKVNMSEAKYESIDSYKTFSQFFTRELKANARTIEFGDTNIVSPVDGTISQIASINNSQLIQAKDKYFSLTDLVGSTSLVKHFIDGSFVNIYLSPKDYHRIHMPCAGDIKEVIYIPGKFYSVSPYTAENIDNLFAINERVVCYFNTSHGSLVIVLVGAMIVGSIELSFKNDLGKLYQKKNKLIKLNFDKKLSLNQGDELARFNLGSTVIMCLNNTKFDSALQSSSKLLMGQKIASVINV